ncbi:MAG: DUF4230 domain-containing protein [Anaerolineaceae bacterium]|nr:DUF4230 domain-containing protein [Anaerolineaceae bacterium]
MEKRKNLGKTLIIVLLVVLLVATIGAIIFLTVGIRRAIVSTVSPLQEANQAISDQVNQLLHPTPTVLPDPITIIRDVQSMARLETIQYTVEKVITAEINQGVFGPLFGDKLLFVAHGYVIAGVDLSKLTVEDLVMDGDVLRLNLPDAEVFVATLNNDDSYVYDRTTGIFKKSDPDLETDARQAAEEEILNAAVDDGILEQAQINAEAFMERLFNDLGYDYVVFE